MKVINYPKLDEKVIYEKLDNGLEIYIVPKKDYHKTCAVFTTKFGGLHHGHEIEVNGKIEHVLPGAAHFLEHRIFDYKGKDVMNLFFRYGASCNAYTAFDRTSYYITTSKNFNKCLNLLLDFVQEFNVSEKSVNNEKNIIIQESLMGADDPEFILHRRSLKCLYENHPYKQKIIGDTASIKKTTFKHLKACHEYFYHPSNMILVIVGKVDEENIIKEIKLNQNNKKFKEKPIIKIQDFKEKTSVVKEYYEEEINRSFNLINVSIKMQPIDNYLGFDRAKIEAIYDILLSMLFGKKSFYYEKLIKDKISNGNSNFTYSNYNQMSFLGVQDNSVYKVEEYIKLTKEVFTNAEKYLLDKTYFDYYKRGMMSTFIYEFNNIENLALEISTIIADNNNFFDKLEVIKSISYDDIVECANNIKKGNMSIVVLRGKNND